MLVVDDKNVLGRSRVLSGGNRRLVGHTLEKSSRGVGDGGVGGPDQVYGSDCDLDLV